MTSANNSAHAQAANQPAGGASWDAIPRDNLKPFLEKHTLTALRILAVNWILIAFSFAIVIVQPTWYTIIVAMIILGGRQLGLGILTHECAHRSFVASRPLGEWLGNWLCGAPVMVDLEIYRQYHMTHHVKTGTADDPDLVNYRHYPVSTSSLLRKFARDLVGITGLRSLVALAFLYGQKPSEKSIAGYSYKPVSSTDSTTAPAMRIAPLRLLWNLRRSVIANAGLFAVFVCLNHPLVYLLWPASWMTTYMVFTRIRNAAEHGALAGTSSNDVWGNTRTVEANWFERLTVAPNYVNYHFEHHLAPTVPSYNLPKLHQWMIEQGAFQRAPLELGYGQILRRLVGQTKPGV